MTALKDQLQQDLSAAMKSRDELRTATLRMVLSAVRNEEVAGKSARVLSDEETLKVLTREGKKRREAAEAFDAAGRVPLAERERAEGEVIDGYLPSQLDDAAISTIVTRVIDEVGAAGMQDMGKVMKPAQAAVGGAAEGGRVAAEVRRQLAAK